MAWKNIYKPLKIKIIMPKFTMKNQVTFTHLLAIMSILVLPLLGWGVGVEKAKDQTYENKKDIEDTVDELKNIRAYITTWQIQQNKVSQEFHNEVMEGLHKIELKLENKKDRE